MLVKTPASWAAQSFSTCPETPLGPTAFLGFTVLSMRLTWYSSTLRALLLWAGGCGEALSGGGPSKCGKKLFNCSALIYGCRPWCWTPHHTCLDSLVSKQFSILLLYASLLSLPDSLLQVGSGCAVQLPIHRPEGSVPFSFSEQVLQLFSHPGFSVRVNPDVPVHCGDIRAELNVIQNCWCTVGTERIQTLLNFSLFVSFAKIKNDHFISH